jgi:RNA polymerase sigma-32 factor
MPLSGSVATPAIRSLLRRPNLTAERERQLLQTRRASRDEEARHQALSELWESHTKLVVSVARQYRRADLDMTDLVGAGHLGMHAAIEGFDPDRYDTRLSTYAIRWIRHYIQDYIRRHAYPVRPPASTAHRQLFRTTGRLFADARLACHREGIPPSDGELCSRVGARIGLPGDEVAQCLSLARGDALHLDASEADAPSIERRLVAQDASPEDAVILRLDHAKLRRRILVLAGEVLGERERKVFLARCMSDDEAGIHQENLAADLGVTRERVHQLEASAKRKIVMALTRDGLLDQANGRLDMPRSRASRRTHRSLSQASA